MLPLMEPKQAVLETLELTVLSHSVWKEGWSSLRPRMHARPSICEASLMACVISLGLALKESAQGKPTFHTAQVNSVRGGVAQS